MNLPKLQELDLNGKRVLVRADLDIPFDGEVVRDISRIKNCAATFRYVLENGARQLLILGHIGKYEGPEKTVSTRFLIKTLSEVTGQEIAFAEGMPPTNIPQAKVVLLDNVRMNEGEEKNDESFAKALASIADVYVNEALATSHRSHTSIVSLPKILPHAAGLRFAEEIAKLSEIRENPKRPLIAIISGVKQDKLDYIQNLIGFCDKILIGGRLPFYIEDQSPLRRDPKVLVGKLLPDNEDLTIHTIESFQKEIATAGTIVLAGVPGKYEEEGHRQGTKEVFNAVACSAAFKLMGGGDSEAAASLLGLTEKFDWISTAGGAMLDFLAKGSLPGIEALT